MADEEYKNFINRVYDLHYAEGVEIESSKDPQKKTAENKKRIKQYAQRVAIDRSFVDSILNYYPNVTEKEIWKNIAHVYKVKSSDLNEFGLTKEEQEEVVRRCVSAHQSWVKASGHSFERYVSSIQNEDLQKNEIKFVLQKELTTLIKGKKLSNTPKDIDGLQSWGKDFDLYAIQKIHDDVHVFGCIQSKTSIRDRVGRDVGFSKNAMDGLFWSVAVTLDGSFLHMPEFIHMVNGGNSYSENGWHGMYVILSFN